MDVIFSPLTFRELSCFEPFSTPIFFFILFSAFTFTATLTHAQNSYAILEDWADYIGFQDTIYKIPSMYDLRDNFVTASFTVDSATGAEMLPRKISKYEIRNPEK